MVEDEIFAGEDYVDRRPFDGEADLTEAVFDECDLSGAIFARTVLESADFRTARHFAIDPELNRIREAQFSRDGLEGLLQTYEIEVE